MATLQKRRSMDSTGSSQMSSPTPSPMLERQQSIPRRQSLTGTAGHNYVPFIPRRESMNIRDRICGASEVFKDCLHAFPYIMDDGSPMLVSEFDFHHRMAKKYKALLGDKYVYPMMTAGRPKLTEEEMQDITIEDKVIEHFIPLEVEVMIPGGIRTIKKDQAMNLYMFPKEGEESYVAGIKTVMNKEMKEFEEKQAVLANASKFCIPSNVTSITSNEIIEQLCAGMEVPNVRRVRNLLGLMENQEQALEKLRQLGILDIEVKVDNDAYFNRNNKNCMFDFGADYRNFKDDEEIDFSEFEKTPTISEVEESDKPADSSFESESEKPADSSFESESDKPADSSFESESDKPADSSFESEVDIEPHKLTAKNPQSSIASCDSGLDVESPPLSPITNEQSPVPAN